MIGKTISHYRVLARVGAGGMGEVYRAHDEQLDREVALKVLPADALTDDTARTRLFREARTASKLNHPNVCTIHEVGEAEGRAYIAMEFVEGKPLSELLGGQSLPLESVLRYGSQIADALAHAHERQVVHRDLKSANVVITSDGRAKVLDFGLAKRMPEATIEEATRSQASLTEAGTLVGTLAYMAPEQLRGEPADARSDIWALGIVLYELVKGTRPFQGQTGFELSSSIMNQPPPPLPGKVPLELRAVIEQCLAKDPARRYQRAGEVRAALDAIQKGTTAPWLGARYLLARRGWLLLSAAVVVIVALLVGLKFQSLRERLWPAAQRIESLAVLPLENLSRNPEQDYFSDGMTEALIAELSKISALKVISRTSVMQYKGARKSLPQIARELGVDGVIEGSIARDADQVRITVQLIDGRTDRHTWAESYQRELKNILDLQSEVARAIAREIRVTVTSGEAERLSRGRPVNPAAHEEYLKGRQFWGLRTRASLERAIQHFEKAVQIDSAYALGYVGLADAYYILGQNGFLPVQETHPKAKQFLQQALRLDDNLGEAHTTLGSMIFFTEWDWQGALREFERGNELNPGNANGHHWYGFALGYLGQHEKSIAELKKARSLDPLSPRINTNVALMLIMARRYEEALTELDNLARLFPDNAQVYVNYGFAYSLVSRHDEAIRAMEKATELLREPRSDLQLSIVLARAGRHREARKMYEKGEKIPRGMAFRETYRAITLASLGEIDKAFAVLEEAFAERSRDMIFIPVSPFMDSLRNDPRFKDLLRRMKFPE